ncbi:MULTISPECIES: cupin domain-containing protein [unclassified Nocardioides]|nr:MULTISPECIES: cupin domain-containing protein [unclassified Nocardioides]
MSPSETDLQHRWQCLAPARTVPSAADALVGCVVSRGFDLGLEP